MKLTVIGGAGVRTPRLIPSLVRRANDLGLQELWLMDIDREKLNLIGRLCETMARQQNAPFRMILTTDAQTQIISSPLFVLASNKRELWMNA